MAEEKKVEGQEGQQQQNQESQTEEEIEGTGLSELEEQASGKGWTPEKEWVDAGKDPAEWRSAREFLDRGELLDRIKDQSRELKSLGAIVGQLSEQNKQVYKAGYVKAVSDLKAARINAMKEGDAEAVGKIEDAIDQAKEAIQKIDQSPTVRQTQVQETEAFVRFKTDNPWFMQNETMKKWAFGTGIAYANEHPNATEEQVYRHVEQEVKKEFPDKFQRRAPPSPDGESRRGTTSSSNTKSAGSFEKLMASLPEDQARVARDMVKRGYVTKEKYVQDYEAIAVGR